MAAPRSPEAFWNRSLAETRHLLDCGTGGLSTVEAAERLQRFGPNLVRREPRLSLLLRFADRFRNPLIMMLLGAAVLSAVTGDRISFIIIVAMVVLSVTLDSVQEHRAATAAERLKLSVGLHELVLRDGAERRLPAAEIVPGDIIRLAAGDLVPADGLVIEARDFFVNEALLTGEAYPCEKQAIAGAGGDPSHAAFAGCSVVSGSASVLVVQTGPNTQLGHIADTLRSAPPPAALERGVHQFGMMIIRLTVPLVLSVLMVNLALQRPMVESFQFALALAVGLTPELLPMVLSVTLARGAIRLAARQVIVKRLAAIHDLGGMDVLCTDKTGTLTEARISLAGHVGPGGADSPRVFELAWLNSRFETGLRSPLDAAVLERPYDDGAAWHKVDEVPFGFERRRVSVLVERAGERLLIVKGAPEDVLALCDRLEVEAGKASTLDAKARAGVMATFEALSRTGNRLLGIAWRPAAADQVKAAATDETGLIFAGFAVFVDPPKASAAAAIDALRRLGVATKVVTGDNEFVARHVCAEIGIGVDAILTGAQIEQLGDDALLARVETVDLFCRVTPAQKHRIILALKRRGHTVGYLGDGINDAPSLHAADVGISVDSAVDVAKDAADMILLERDLGVIEAGVREGRRTYANIMKCVMMGTSSNFGNMCSMAAASVLLPFLPMQPIQVLLNNLIYDLSQVPIPLDDVDPDALSAPRRWDIGFIRGFMLALGLLSSVFDLLTFGILLWVFDAGMAQFQTGWFVESLATQVLVVFVIRTGGNPLRARPHPLLAGTALGAAVLAGLLPYLPVGAWFGLVPLPLDFFAALAVLTACYLVLAQFAKTAFLNFHRRRAGKQDALDHDQGSRPQAAG